MKQVEGEPTFRGTVSRLCNDNKRKLVVCQVHLVHVEIMFIARSLYK